MFRLFYFDLKPVDYHFENRLTPQGSTDPIITFGGYLHQQLLVKAEPVKMVHLSLSIHEKQNKMLSDVQYQYISDIYSGKERGTILFSERYESTNKDLVFDPYIFIEMLIPKELFIEILLLRENISTFKVGFIGDITTFDDEKKNLRDPLSFSWDTSKLKVLSLSYVTGVRDIIKIPVS